MNQRAVRGSFSHTVCLRRLMEKNGPVIGLGYKKDKGGLEAIRYAVGVYTHIHHCCFLLNYMDNNIWTLSKNRKT